MTGAAVVPTAASAEMNVWNAIQKMCGRCVLHGANSCICIMHMSAFVLLDIQCWCVHVCSCQGCQMHVLLWTIISRAQVHGSGDTRGSRNNKVFRHEVCW
jgi:hypothetical protein